MKKSIFLSISTLSVLLMPVSASAAVGQLISGPTGPSSNGWFSSVPTLRVDSNPSCPSGASGNVSAILRTSEEGQHRITIRSHMNSYPRIYRDDQINGTETSGEIFSCPALSQPYQDVDPEIVWQGTVKIDLSAPTISISTPTNNSNTSSSTVSVTGSANDAVSGVQSVVVNGVGASLSSGSFSATVPVNVGLNTLTATVTDNAGHTAQSQVVVNRNASSSDDKSNKANKTDAGTTTGTNSKNDGTTDSKQADSKDGTGSTDEPTSTPKKVAAGTAATAAAGVGVASYFGYVPYRRIGEFLVGIIGK